MGRKLQVEWQETAAELKSLYHQEKLVARRTRLFALWHLRTGKKQKAVAEMMGISLRILERWVAWYREGGLAAVLKRIKGYHAQGVASKLTLTQQKALVARVLIGDFRTVWDVIEWVQARWGVTYRYHGMYSLMRKHHLALKVPRPYSEKADQHQQEQWKKGAYSLN